MTLSEYMGTSGGRIAFLSAAVAALGGGLFILLSSPGTAMLALTAGLSLSVTGFIAALVIGIRQTPKFVLIALCFLPPFGGVYFALCQMFRNHQTSAAAYALLAIAAICIGVAAASKGSGEAAPASD